MKHFLLLLISLAAAAAALAAPPLGQTLPSVTLEGKAGGLVAGGAWRSEALKGKTILLFYIDPDEKTLNDEAIAEFAKQKRNDEKFQSVVVINMAATWLPNVAIQSSLEAKQKEFPQTQYARDMSRVLVQAWNLGDDNNDVMLLDATGKVLFAKDGKLTPAETQTVI